MIREEAEVSGRIAFRGSSEGVRVYASGPVLLTVDEARLDCSIAPSAGPVEVLIEVPLANIAALWRPSAGYELRLPPDWSGQADVSGILGAPVGVLHDQDGRASAGFAVDPPNEPVTLHYGVSEESAAFVVKFSLDAADHDRRIIVDLGGGELFDTVARLRRTVQKVAPHRVAALADEPVYSTWYSFHDALDAGAILEEARLAKELGFGCLFLDYGWQRLGDSRYFDGCGDWVADEEKFPDLAATVREIQSIGLGVVLWVAPLLLGERSDAYATLGAGALHRNPSLRSFILDPRRPEVREHVIESLLRLVEELHVDGLKIDFIDAASVYAAAGDVATHGEIAAAATLMLDDLRRATDAAGFPDLLFEYREPYVGLGLAASGDVIRAEDCPGDFIANRRATIDLRVFSTGQRVHSDMMMWDPGLSSELVGVALSHAAFSVPQISMRLASMAPEARNHIATWLSAWRDVRDVALRGRIVGVRPQLHYPSATAVHDDESLSVVWSSDSIVTVPASARRAVVVNGTTSTRLSVRLPAAGVARVVDHLGAETAEHALGSGIADLDIPVGGRARITVE